MQTAIFIFCGFLIVACLVLGAAVLSFWIEHLMDEDR